MKFIRKAAAIALVGAMIVTTVQTAAPDVVKAQVSYDTTVKIDTSLVPRDNNIEVIEKGDTPLISTLANVQFDLDCNVDCIWTVKPESTIESEAGADKVKIDKMGHVTIEEDAAQGTYNITASGKNLGENTTIIEAMCKITVRSDEAVKAKSIILDKEKIEEQSPYVKVTNEGKGLQIDGTVKNVKLYTEVKPAYLLDNDVDFEGNKFVNISEDTEDGTNSLLTSYSTGKGTIQPTVGKKTTVVSFDTQVNGIAYGGESGISIKCEEKKAADKDGTTYQVLANEELNFYIDDNKENTLPQVITEKVNWTMKYGNGESISIDGKTVKTKLGTFEFSYNGKSVQLKTPIIDDENDPDAYKKYQEQLKNNSQITLDASIPYQSAGDTTTVKYRVKQITLSFSEKESSLSDVGLDFEKAGLIRDKDYTIREETIGGKTVPVYYFENSDSEDEAIDLWAATHADREGIRKFEESREDEDMPFSTDSYYPTSYRLSNLSEFNDENAINKAIIDEQTNNKTGIIKNPGKLLKVGTGYTALTMQTSIGKDGTNLTHKYILRFVSSAKDMKILHTQYDKKEAEYNNNAVIHIRQGEADTPNLYVSGKEKKINSLYDPFVEFSFKEIKGEKVASAASDSTSEILINGLSTGKVEVIATSVVDKTKKASYILYVNDEFLTPKEIQIDISDAISRSVMDAEGNVNGHYENIPLKVRATGTSVGIPPVEWSSEDEKFATITQDGLLTTLKSTGDKTVTITATSKANRDLKATLELHIKDVTATGISTIDEKVKEGEKAAVTMGEANAGTCKAYTTFQLYAKEYLPANATKADGQITWHSSNEKVASIDASGNVTTYAEGNTVITARYTSGDADTQATVFNLTVKGFADVIESIECASTVELTRVKDSFTLVPVVKPDNASNKQLMYESQNPSIATVTDNGVITAVAPGTTTIVIASVVKPSVKKEVTVTVKGEADLKPNTTPQTQQPAVQPIAPTPADTNAQSGNNTGVNVIQTKAAQKKPVIKLAKKVIKKKKSTKIIVLNKASGAKVSYKVAKKYKKIVSVSKKGKVTAKKKGTAKIVVTVKQSGKTFKKTLTIKVK